MWCKNIAGRFLGLVTKYTCDGQNYDSQNRANIAASHGKKSGINMTNHDSAVLHINKHLDMHDKHDKILMHFAHL